MPSSIMGILAFFPDPLVSELMSRAHAARANAYCPYSQFRVGAAVLCPDGKIFTGILTTVHCSSFSV